MALWLETPSISFLNVTRTWMTQKKTTSYHLSVIGRVVIVDVKEDSSVAVLTDVHTLSVWMEKGICDCNPNPF